MVSWFRLMCVVPPEASNVNFGPGTVDPNVAAAPIGVDGEVCYLNSVHSDVDVVADHLGTIDGDAFTFATKTGAPDRKIDTRNRRPATTGALNITARHRARGTHTTARFLIDADNITLDCDGHTITGPRRPLPLPGM